jgi:hypothetical protein
MSDFIYDAKRAFGTLTLTVHENSDGYACRSLERFKWQNVLPLGAGSATAA